MTTLDRPAPEVGPPPDPPPPPRRTALALMSVFTVLAVLAALFGGGLLKHPPGTSDGDWAGETVEVVIPLAEGGGTDTWARFVGQGLARTIPGAPGFAPVNDAGGEGIVGTNRFVADAEPTGTHLLVSTATSVVPWILKRREVAYDFTELTPVVANGTGAVIYARAAAGVKGPADLVGRAAAGRPPLRFGGISATGLDLTTLVALDLIGADVQAIFGFEGRGPVNLALQRGEVDLDYQTTSAWGPAVAPMVADGTAVPLMALGQLGPDGEVVRDPNFPDVPTVVEVYAQLHGKAPEGEAYEAYRGLLGATYTYQKAMWVPAGTPREAVETLRTSAQRLGADPRFQAEAEKVLGGYPLVADADLADRVREAYTIDDAARAYVVALLRDRYGVELD
jgi:tripartite-type tricarboxylate transporter receptor subunit TctC